MYYIFIFMVQDKHLIQLSKTTTMRIYENSFKHFHTEYLFTFITHGNFIFETESAKIEIEENTVGVINSFEFHKAHHSKHRCFRLILSHDCVNSIATKILGKKIESIKFSSIIKDKNTDYTMKQISKELNSEHLNKTKINNLVISFLEHLIRFYTISDQIYYSNNENKILSASKKFICSKYDHKITLDDLAENLNCNKFQILREFKKVYQTTPYQYILMIRANKAKEMILKNMPLSEVAISCGFTDQSNMIKNFKKIYGLTPSVLKKNIHTIKFHDQN